MPLPSINWRRSSVAVLLGETIPIGALIAIVALVGPRDPEGAQAFAQTAGVWVGPIAGAFVVCALSFWAGSASSKPVRQGALIGTAVAIIDVALLASTGAPFALLFVVSNVGKILAGTLGGWLSQKRNQPRVPS